MQDTRRLVCCPHQVRIQRSPNGELMMGGLLVRAVEHGPQVLVQGYILLLCGEHAGEGAELRGMLPIGHSAQQR